MEHFSQSPTQDAFVQNPYPFYDRLRAAGDLALWDDFGLPCAVSHQAVQAFLRDRRFGRACPEELAPEIPAHLKDFYAIEDHSMLELEPPRHTRLRGLVARAFKARTILALSPIIEDRSRRLIDQLAARPQGQPVDLIADFCQPIPVQMICHLLGVPEDAAPDLLRWSAAMVAMYQARRDRALEEAASAAARDFAAFMSHCINQRRAAPRADLLSDLIAAEENGDRLTREELITTCVLLLNAGHEATVHAMGNALKYLLETGTRLPSDPADAAPLVEDILRVDPPLHLFLRYAYEDITLFGHSFRRGDQVALLLGAANRDPAAWPSPGTPTSQSPRQTHSAFGAGLHFCIGAPLARLEMQIALPLLQERFPDMRLTEPPRYANLYPFHGLSALSVTL